MTKEEINRIKYMVCCPMCDKKRCERGADDCDVKRYLQKQENKKDK